MLADQHAAMGANIRNAADFVVAIANQQQRFVERAFEEREGINLTGNANLFDVADQLPALCKNPLVGCFEYRVIRVEPIGWRRCF